MGLVNGLHRKPKSCNEFSISELLQLTETDLIWNLVGGGWLAKLGKSKDSNGLKWPNTERNPKWIGGAQNCNTEKSKFLETRQVCPAIEWGRAIDTQNVILLAFHAVVYNLFNLGWYLVSAKSYRDLWLCASAPWQKAVAMQKALFRFLIDLGS